MLSPLYYLAPCDPEVLWILEDWVRTQGLHLFTVACRRELAALIGDARAVSLIEADCTISDYGDAAEHKRHRARVLKRLQDSGTKLPPGKKPRPEMKAMVGSVVGIMVAFGMQVGSGENSKMVQALRAIASELDMRGDPRDELRRIIKLTKSLQARDQARHAAHLAALEEFVKAFR
ncbi:hypothetical protein WG922_17460 [Ramlibacter sp. AN1015]|uniref:hypothetical protein n=1 Tax=Ramlibacter sp. AN1015 TaxID=3133428 RepID=UPI0030C2F9A1